MNTTLPATCWPVLIRGVDRPYTDCAVTTKCIDVSDVNFNYTPSSATVASASLQVIVKGGSATRASYDGAQFFIPGTTTTPVVTSADLNGDGKVDALGPEYLIEQLG
ncbi:MAG: hypothetical protein WDN27_00735 [Candidatus Saccharibacteria bacterium]